MCEPSFSTLVKSNLLQINGVVTVSWQNAFPILLRSELIILLQFFIIIIVKRLSEVGIARL